MDVVREPEVDSTEPVGIVISRGKRDEPVPVLWAYLWSAAPETAPTVKPKAA